VDGVKRSNEHNETLDVAEPEISNKILTIPNLLCLVRLVGSFILIPIAWQGRNEVFLWCFIFLAMTDWVDGKLAILLNQRTVLGARLDSWADAALYAAGTLCRSAVRFSDAVRRHAARRARLDRYRPRHLPDFDRRGFLEVQMLA
jgi:hypothetical protein